MKTLLIILMVLYSIQVYAPPAAKFLTKEQSIEFQSLTQPFSVRLFQEALNVYVLYPKTAMAQAKLETGNFTSNIWKENHNAFGMHQPKVRQTLSIGENRHCAKYYNWLDSVKDYRMFQDYWISKGKPQGEILSLYCPEKGYSKRVKNLINKL